MIIMEVCVNCIKQQKDNIEQQIRAEIEAFLKNPNKFYVRFNPVTGFYKFELIENE